MGRGPAHLPDAFLTPVLKTLTLDNTGIHLGQVEPLGKTGNVCAGPVVPRDTFLRPLSVVGHIP